MSSKDIPNIETFVRYIKSVPALGEPSAEQQLLHLGFVKMTKNEMMYNEVMELGPEGSEGFVLVPICYN